MSEQEKKVKKKAEPEADSKRDDGKTDKTDNGWEDLGGGILIRRN